MNSAPRLFIVDDHPLLRGGLRHLIGTETGWSVCGEASNGGEALDRIPPANPDIVILDLGLPDMFGLEVIKRLHACRPDIPIVVLSMHDELLYAERVIRAGGRGYLIKGAPADEFLKAVTAVLGGSLFFSERVTDAIVSRPGYDSSRCGIASLSDRELEVFQLVGRGMGSTRIGGTLGISPRTVDAHRTNIRLKLGLSDAAEVLREAILWVEIGCVTGRR